MTNPRFGVRLTGRAVASAREADQRPLVLKLGTAVLVQGEAVVDLHLLAEMGIRFARRDGIGSARLEPLRAVLAETATQVRSMSEAGHADVRAEPQPSESDMTEPLTTQEVATMLHIGRRQAQRMATTLDAHRLRTGVLVFDRATVESYVAGREVAA